MSYKENVEAFIRMLKNEPSLFSDQDKAELNELIRDFSVDNVEQVSDSIETWFRSRPEILKAHNASTRHLREQIRIRGIAEKNAIAGGVYTPEHEAEEKTRGAGGTHTPPEYEAEEDSELIKRLIENILRQSPTSHQDDSDKTAHKE